MTGRAAQLWDIHEEARETTESRPRQSPSPTLPYARPFLADDYNDTKPSNWDQFSPSYSGRSSFARPGPEEWSSASYGDLDTGTGVRPMTQQDIYPAVHPYGIPHRAPGFGGERLECGFSEDDWDLGYLHPELQPVHAHETPQPHHREKPRHPGRQRRADAKHRQRGEGINLGLEAPRTGEQAQLVVNHGEDLINERAAAHSHWTYDSIWNGVQAEILHFAQEWEPERLALWMHSQLGQNKGPGADVAGEQLVSVQFDSKDLTLYLGRQGSPRSLVTVTSSTSTLDVAFADTAECYIQWQWPRHGLKLFDWLLSVFGAEMGGEEIHNKILTLEGDVQVRYLSDGPSTTSWQVAMIGSVENIAAIVSELAWIAAAFSRPLPEGNSVVQSRLSSRGLVETCGSSYESFHISRYTALGSDAAPNRGTCWAQAFTGFAIAAGFPVPSRPKGFLGIELSFGLMYLLTGINYPMPFEDGFVLKGRGSAVVPTSMDQWQQSSAVQWHLLRTEAGSRLSMQDVQSDLMGAAILKATEPLEDHIDSVVSASNRHFLGLYTNARIHLGMRDSHAEEITSVDGDPDVRSSSGWRRAQWQRTIQPSVGVSAFAASLGLGTQFNLVDATRQRLTLEYETPLPRLVDETRSNLSLLYDVRARTAWLVPEICVITHLMQAYNRRNNGLFHFSTPDYRLKDARDWTAQVASSLSSDAEVARIFRQFAMAFEQMKEDVLLKPRGSKLLAFFPGSQALAGVDFTELSSLPKTYSCKEVQVQAESGGPWPQVLKDNWEATKGPRIVTMFCNGLQPEPIIPEGPTSCAIWYPPPVDSDYLFTTVACVKRLAEVHGRDPVKLSPNHFWAPGRVDPHGVCPRRNCDRLQKVVSKPPKRRMYDVLYKAPPDGAIVFGGKFCFGPQQTCRALAPAVRHAAPSQAAGNGAVDNAESGAEWADVSVTTGVISSENPGRYMLGGGGEYMATREGGERVVLSVRGGQCQKATAGRNAAPVPPAMRGAVQAGELPGMIPAGMGELECYADEGKQVA